MSAQDLRVAVYVFPPGKNTQGTRANEKYSYINTIQGSNLITLSTKNPNSFDPIQGLLYAPTLPDVGTCSNDTLELFPANATTVNNVVSPGVGLVSVFPWTSIACTQAFLATSRSDVVKAAIVFNTIGGIPPPADDPSWSLNDGGSWQNDDQFPVYAVSTDIGEGLLTNLGQYSGNVSTMPYASYYSTQFPTNYLPRLGVSVDLNGSTVPSLWTFLIIVLAVLLGLIICVSIIMHFLQRRQRHNLQRRLQRGEVDLESLGIKKMNVPQEQITAMPQYKFNGEPTNDDATTTTVTNKTKSKVKSTTHQTAFSQSVCPICLEDFVSNETMIRELPCKHIYHPECIDPFLRDNSSLCPMCKKSALPPGFCPVTVTNLMVRRERLVRRMREQRNGGPPPPQTIPQKIWYRIQKILRFGAGEPVSPAPDFVNGSRRRAQDQSENQEPDVELAEVTETQPETQSETRPETQPETQSVVQTSARDSEMPPEVASQGTAARRAWRREYIARQQQRNFQEQAETARRADEGRSFVRRAMDRILPGLG